MRKREKKHNDQAKKSGAMKKILTSVIFMTLVFYGCMVGPDFQKPVVDTPDHYQNDTATVDTVVNLAWWDLFNDSILGALVDTALIRNQDVLIAASRVEEARAVVGYTKADQYPVFGYSLDGSRSKMSVLGEKPSTFNSFSAMGNVSWELDFWGKYRRATENARASLLASEYGRRAVMISLISEVAQRYFALLDYRARLEVSRQTYLTRQKGLEIMRAKYEYGTIPEVDVNQAEIQEAIAAAAIPVFERQVAKTEYALQVLLGHNPAPLTEVSTLDQVSPPDSIPVGLPSGLLERRPDILEAEQTLAAQNAMIGVATAMRFPSISLTASFGMASGELSSMFSPEGIAWAYGGGLLGPLFNFGKNKRRVEIERQRTEQARLFYVKTVLNAFREVEEALVEIRTYRKELLSKQIQMKAASNASRLSYERYNKGVTSYLEVLDSERSLFNAQLAVAETYRNELNAYVKLYKALGGGWISRTEKQQVLQNQTQTQTQAKK